MNKLKRNRGIEELKSRYGIMFISPWILGVILFFVYPLIQSIIFSFSKVTIDSNGVKTSFVGFEHYVEAWSKDPNYTTWLQQSLLDFCYSLPIILILSLVLAIILNEKFRGRIFFRALYFLPVIIATGKVMGYIFDTTGEDVTSMGVTSGVASGMLSVEDLVTSLNLSVKVAGFVSSTINNIFNLVWSSGIQIVLFLSGLQSIPRSLYEASRVEGATKWEEFWFITFPMLSRITLLVGVFTMVELFINERTELVENVFAKIRSTQYDISSAMLWIYFIAVAAIMGVIMFLYYRFIMKRYDT